VPFISIGIFKVLLFLQIYMTFILLGSVLETCIQPNRGRIAEATFHRRRRR
jgi:hypothetical protein